MADSHRGFSSLSDGSLPGSVTVRWASTASESRAVVRLTVELTRLGPVPAPFAGLIVLVALSAGTLMPVIALPIELWTSRAVVEDIAVLAFAWLAAVALWVTYPEVIVRTASRGYPDLRGFEATVRLDAAGVHLERGPYRHDWDWDAVTAHLERRAFVVAWAGRRPAIAVPTRAFTDDQARHAFVLLLAAHSPRRRT